MGKYILFTHFYPITADISDKMHIILKLHPIKKIICIPADDFFMP